MYKRMVNMLYAVYFLRPAKNKSGNITLMIHITRRWEHRAELYTILEKMMQSREQILAVSAIKARAYEFVDLQMKRFDIFSANRSKSHMQVLDRTRPDVIV